MSKKFLVVSAIVAFSSSTAFAGNVVEKIPSISGAYLGVEGGYGVAHWKNLDGMNAKISNTEGVGSFSPDNGFVGRGFIGYDINRYFALESGYTNFFNKTGFEINNVKYDEIKTSAIDIFGKIKAPVTDNFGLYAKLGGDYLMSRFSRNNNKNSFNVAFGAGAEYNFTQNIIVNIEWLRFGGNPKINANTYQPDSDALMVGIRYKIAAIGSPATALSTETIPAVTESNSGFYLGIGGGYGITHRKYLDSTAARFGTTVGTANFSSDSGFASRGFFGYDINRYFALEGGYTYFSNKVKLEMNNVKYFDLKTSVVDVVSKIKAPIANNFDLYAKLGGDFLINKMNAATNSVSDGAMGTFNVAYGAGVDYSITPNIIANAEWMRFYGNSKVENDYQPAPDVFMFGIRYKFLL